MSTKAIIGLIAAVVVIGGGAWYFSSKGTEGGAAMMGTEEKKEEAKGMGSFAELVGKAGSWKCTVKTNVEQAPSEGVAYIADGKVRADFSSKIAALGGKEVKSSMIQVDGYVYTWSDMIPQGMKMKIPENTATPQAQTSGGFDYSAQVDYDCGPWMMDATKFDPPASVTFMELGKNGMPQGMPAGMPQGAPVPN